MKIEEGNALGGTVMSLARGAARSWVCWAALPLAAFVAGCDRGPDRPGTAADDTQVATAELVGSVQLSATHDVKFWDYGNGLARIEENLHADQDRGATLTLNTVAIEGRTLSNVYEVFAGANADPGVLEKLHALDLRVAAAAAGTLPSAVPHPSATNPQGPVAGLARPPATAQPETPSNPDGLEVRRGAALCAEPAGYDWAADGRWFIANYCNADSHPTYSCEWSKPSISEEWSPPVYYYRSTGLNQSFCTGAGYLVKYQIVANGVTSYSSTLISGTIPIRWVRDDAWTAPANAHFMSMIWSATGSNTVGLTLHEVQSGP